MRNAGSIAAKLVAAMACLFVTACVTKFGVGGPSAATTPTQTYQYQTETLDSGDRVLVKRLNGNEIAAASRGHTLAPASVHGSRRTESYSLDSHVKLEFDRGSLITPYSVIRDQLCIEWARDRREMSINLQRFERKYLRYIKS